MNRKYCNAWFLPCLLGFLLLSCSQNGNEQVIVEEGNCPPAPQAAIASQVDTLNIIIETSGSMGGFMPTGSGVQTDFQKQVDNMLANAESLEGNRIETLRYYSARERMYKEVYSRFSQMLRRGLRNVGSSSPIPQMLSNITDKLTGQEQVSIFISDFIYAPPNPRDRDFISNDIRRALAKVRQEDFVVSVFASQSNFVGTYYPAGAKSTPIRNCCSTPIPYYIWVIGPEEQVRLVNQEVIKSNYMDQVHFGFDTPPPAYMIIPGSGRTGEWYPADQEGKVIQLDNARAINQDPVTYTVGLQLENMPGQVSDQTFLKDNLHLLVQNGEAVVEAIYDQQEFLNQEEINNKDRELIGCFSHFVKIKVTQVFDRRSDIRVGLALENELPSWVDAYTTQDDRLIQQQEPATFALNAIMEGVSEATGREERGFFNLTTTIDLSR